MSGLPNLFCSAGGGLWPIASVPQFGPSPLLAEPDIVIQVDRSEWSFRLDSGEFDHLGPLFCFRGDELAELGRRADKHGRRQIGKSCLQLGIGKACIDLLVEPFDDLAGRVLWCTDAEPRISLIARK